jgi:hypothetical protein
VILAPKISDSPVPMALRGITNMAAIRLAVLTACDLPSVYHPASWQLTSWSLNGCSGSLSQLHNFTSQWLLAETPALYPACLLRFSLKSPWNPL